MGDPPPAPWPWEVDRDGCGPEWPTLQETLKTALQQNGVSVEDWLSNEGINEGKSKLFFLFLSFLKDC